MPICASGEIALGGSTVGRSVNLELSRSATAAICMNETAVRSLAGVPSGAISMNCFYGRSAPPTSLGQVYEGGYYTGVIDIGGGVTYYMVLSPQASGESRQQWKTSRTSTAGTCSTVDGRLNTSNMNNSDHPAAQFTATRSINGYADWYFPALNETGTMFTNRGSMPAGQGYGGLGGTLPFTYFTSTENGTFAWTRCFTDGSARNNGYKNNAVGGLPVRALRRVRT